MENMEQRVEDSLHVHGARIKKKYTYFCCAGQTRSSAYLIIFLYLNLNLQTF